MTKKFFLLLFTLFLWVFSKPAFANAGAHFSVNPTSGNYSSDFSIEINVDTGSQPSGGSDVSLIFPADLLEVKTVTKGTAYSDVAYQTKNDQGKLLIYATFPTEAAGDYFTGTGLVATLSFGKKGNGEAQVSFLCTAGATNDSNIVQKGTNQDIIVCSENVGGTYTLGTTSPTSGPTPTPGTTTPSPTSSTSPTSTTTRTPTPSTLPVSGFTLPTIIMLGGGSILIFLSFLAIF